MSYIAVVDSGSCSTGEEREHCGHTHRTIEGALHCLQRMTSIYDNHRRILGLRSAPWYHSTIHNGNGEEVIS